MNMDVKNGSPDPPGDRNTTSDPEMEDADRSRSATGLHNNGDSHGPLANGQKTSNAKDPSRPRRKKARRACFACQRAHLTCGDERPCQRCIKRGLQDACHDGVRKKAKYLHDAPDGALMPSANGPFFNNNGNANNNDSTTVPPNNLALARSGSNGVNTATPQSNSGPNFYPGSRSNSYNVYSQENAIGQNPFATHSPVSPTFNMKSTTTGQNPTLSSAPSVNQQPPNPTVPGAAANQSQNPISGAFFDPSDPALFNFDLSSMNFENRYGALEFGMLGHMATGAGDSPSDSATQRGSMGRSGSTQFSSTTPITGNAGFGESPNSQPFMFGDPLLNEWPSGQSQGAMGMGSGGSVYAQMSGGTLNKPDAPHAFAIESGPHLASPSTTTASPHGATHIEDGSNANNSSHAMSSNNKANGLAPSNQRPTISTPSLKQQSLNLGGVKRRQRNPSYIYESVKEPYPYTNGFHSLTAFIQRRFSPQKTLQIAKSLASIRPSFIATTKTLNRDDLIFMERCFQRTLFEYEDFINACGTPTIVCRRTGEIAAVGKEFSILTGWKKEVLLGKEPNLNVNTGRSASVPPSEVSSRASSFAPRDQQSSGNGTGPGRPPQPVFLAELLDDDSVVEFYDDFARLAFGDSRGSVMTTCKLLKYKTREDMDQAQGQADGSPNSGPQKWNNHLRKGGIAGEAGMNQLGFKDGKVECSYCWTVKRDVFDIPMLIVMNFLPCI